MTTFNIPTRDTVSPANQALFDNLKKGLGMVPNLYATLAHSDTALGNYLTFQNAKSSINGKARGREPGRQPGQPLRKLPGLAQRHRWHGRLHARADRRDPPRSRHV